MSHTSEMKIGDTLNNTLISYNESQMNNCSSLMLMRNKPLEIFRLTLFVIILLFGTVFNSIAIWVFCFKMRKWSETRVLMLNLLFSDCCSLFSIPFRMYATVQPWDLGNLTCRYIRSVYFMNMYTSIAIITLISVDRYICIKFPLRSRNLRSPKKAAVACGIIWALLTTVLIYRELAVNFQRKPQTFCFRKVSLKPLNVTLYFSILGFYIPLLIVTFCSIEIIRILQRNENQTTHEQQNIKKSINIVSTNLLVFLMCFLPVQIGNIVRFVMESLKLDCSLIKYINDYVYAAQVIADLNCCFDALCYYFVAKEFWESAKDLQVSNRLYMTKEYTKRSSL